MRSRDTYLIKCHTFASRHTRIVATPYLTSLHLVVIHTSNSELQIIIDMVFNEEDVPHTQYSCLANVEIGKLECKCKWVDI